MFIHLSKAPGDSLGLIIVGGQDSKRLTSGIYIKQIKPNSVCEQDGRLNEGEGLLALLACELWKF